MSKMWAYIYEGSFVCDAYLPELQGEGTGGKKDFEPYSEKIVRSQDCADKVFFLNYISLQ